MASHLRPRPARAALAFAALLLAGAAAHAGTAPSTMMANVYRLSEAAAVLEICFASDAYRRLPAAKASALQSLATRLAKLVKAIGQYYEDRTLHPTFEATRARIAGDSKLRLHVKNHYDYCGERLAAEMERYVTENELLLGRYFVNDPPRSTDKRPPEPGPPRKDPRP